MARADHVEVRADATAVRDAPVRQRSLRAHNLGLVLRHVAASPLPVSRADVAAATGLTKATVSTLVDELIAARLLAEIGPAPRSGAGRPAVQLRLASHGPAGLGLEVNVDYLASCVVDLTGAVRHQEMRHADQRGRKPKAILDDVVEMADAALAAADAQGLTVAGSALAVPGLVTNGVVRFAPNLGWVDLDVGAMLADRVPPSLTVDNEANFAALGELEASAKTSPSFLYISGEIGVGAGIVLDGRLFRGARGFAGELGHVTIRPDGPRCHCGARGCLEAYANQEALLRGAGVETVAQLVEQAQTGVGSALAALQDAGAALGVAAATVVNLLDIDTVVLGGSYTPLAPWLTEPIRREVTERALAARWVPVTVRPSVLGAQATVVGAGGSVVRAIRDSPALFLEHRR